MRSCWPLSSMIVINDKKKSRLRAKYPPKIHFAPISAKIGGGACAHRPQGCYATIWFRKNICLVRPIRGQKSLPKFRLRESGLRFLRLGGFVWRNRASIKDHSMLGAKSSTCSRDTYVRIYMLTHNE